MGVEPSETPTIRPDDPAEAATLAPGTGTLPQAPSATPAEAVTHAAGPEVLESGRSRSVAPAVRVPGYEAFGELGRGGMGVVYRAWQPSLGRQVALKCLMGLGDPKAEARFGREIRALGRVDRLNLVKVFTSGSDGEQWFYAMELIEGADLAAVCTQLAGRRLQ